MKGMGLTVEPFVFIFSIVVGIALSVMSGYSLTKKRERKILFLFFVLMAIQILSNTAALMMIKQFKGFFIDLNNELSYAYRLFVVLFEIIHKNIFFQEIPEQFVPIYIGIRSLLYLSSLLIIQLPALSIYLQNMFNVSESILLIFLLFSRMQRYKTKSLRNTLLFRRFLIRRQLLKRLYLFQLLVEIIYSGVMLYMCLVRYNMVLYETAAILRLVSISCLYFCIVGQDEDVKLANSGAAFIKRCVLEFNSRPYLGK